MTGDTATSGRISHVEWFCRDLAVTTGFLQALFGWEFERFSHHYALYTPAAGACVGLMETSHIEPSGGIRFFVQVDDIDAAANRAVTLGGTLEAAAAPIPGYGHYAHIRDPDGNRIGLFQADDPEG